MTTDDIVNLVPTELGATIYVEAIIVDRRIGSANVGTNITCGMVCDELRGFSFTRDIFETRRLSTVRTALVAKGRASANYDPYYRDYNTNSLSAASYSDAIRHRRSLLFVPTGLSDGELSSILRHLSAHREILPSRVPK